MPDRMREDRARTRRTPDRPQVERTDPGAASILRLQRSIGNAGVGRLLSRQPAPPPAAQRFGLDWSVAHPPSDKATANDFGQWSVQVGDFPEPDPTAASATA